MSTSPNLRIKQAFWELTNFSSKAMTIRSLKRRKINVVDLTKSSYYIPIQLIAEFIHMNNNSLLERNIIFRNDKQN